MTYSPTDLSPEDSVMPRRPYYRNGNGRLISILWWEDVLVPMALLTSRLGVRPASDNMDDIISRIMEDEQLKSFCAELDTTIRATLQAGSVFGEVVIVTRQSTKFVDAMASTLFPSTHQYILEGVGNNRRLACQVVGGNFDENASEEGKRIERVKFYRSVCRALMDGDENVSAHAKTLVLTTLLVVTEDASDLSVCKEELEFLNRFVPRCIEVLRRDTLDGFLTQLNDNTDSLRSILLAAPTEARS